MSALTNDPDIHLWSSHFHSYRFSSTFTASI